MDLCARVLALPMHPYLQAAQQSYIADRLQDAVAAGSRLAAAQQ
jgi:dTDP-4-amino-4,6-dideoxygalactose transaminase